MTAPLGPWLDAAYGGPPPERTPHEIGTSICQLLTEILAELRRMNSTERTGAVSSICIEDMVKTNPKVATKSYVGSPITRADADAALDVHGYAHREAARRCLDGWAETVAELTARTNGVASA